ncbi:AAA ATPase-like protein [Elizabethkingia sp. YR214]|uniref:AAA family ATPase n=1 Tax=Elizabethkingia sp. YR214 TaxID=2135667 RepID=UPI000D30CEAB|nr:AAA family ATPase [Elizabethkingia sp. YR214]PUB29445.1 AAA ATPase-like protein [Elizabethkingia sp. YR214]
MQITSLYINNYKLLKDFTINFKKDVSILIGINGSGKSSILEVIAQIFSDCYLDEKSKFGFSIEYEIRLEEILGQTTTSAEFKTEYIKVQISAEKVRQELKYKVFSGQQILEDSRSIERKYGSIEKILPSNIVIYYSGLADIMKKICLPHDEKLSVNYRKGNTAIHRPFFYFEPPLFNLILITLLSYEYGDIPQFLSDRVKIGGVQSIQINLKKPAWGKGKINDWWGAKGEVKTFLDLLDTLDSPLEIKEDDLLSESKGNVIIESWQNENLIITILGQEKLFQIREYFVEEKTLFKVLNTLLIDGFQPEVNFSFFHGDDTEKINTFGTLSEGEQQSIIIRGLIELVNNENTLFLFDEPDTYLHPSWQRKFIENINELAENIAYNNSQFLITTHSPQLLSNADPENSDVQIMEDGEIIKVTPKYYGKDISTILYEMMGVERRNKKVSKLLSSLFNAIEDEEIEESQKQYNSLVELLGDNDPALVRAKTQIDYLEEEVDEADN